MNPSSNDEKVIENYQNDEKLMVLLFAQWCVNHNLNPEELYKRAYPRQSTNKTLTEALNLVLPKEEASDIPNDTLLEMLLIFGNDDLAFIVTEEINKL